MPEKTDEAIRESILKPYRIIYQVDEDRKAIHILRIWHAARGMPELNQASKSLQVTSLALGT